jgi:hypothetical protein
MDFDPNVNEFLPKKIQERIASLGLGALRILDQWIQELIAKKEAEWQELLARDRSGKDSSVSYQQEYVLCGKAGCRCAAGEKHGPYWYAYWTDPLGKTRKKYIGKNLRVKDSSTE